MRLQVNKFTNKVLADSEIEVSPFNKSTLFYSKERRKRGGGELQKKNRFIVQLKESINNTPFYFKLSTKKKV